MSTIKTTPELVKGDIVQCHGMRVLIDGEPVKSRSHPGDSTYYYTGLVLNRDEVPNAAVPVGWTADWKRNARHEPLPHNGEHRWTIQGNELARWSVES